jgi:enoyl-CoA hydratase/carnithine racemase
VTEGIEVNAIATITLNRPEKMNALTHKTHMDQCEYAKPLLGTC